MSSEKTTKVLNIILKVVQALAAALMGFLGGSLS